MPESSYYTQEDYFHSDDNTYDNKYNNKYKNKYNINNYDNMRDDKINKMDDMNNYNNIREDDNKKKYYKYNLDNDDDDESKLNCNVQRSVQVIYLVSAIIWVIITYVFSLYLDNLIIWLLVSVPLIIYGFNFYWVHEQTYFVSKLMFAADFLSIGFLIVTIIINWYKEVDKEPIFGLVVLALFIFGLSMLDVWVAEENFIYMQHIRSALETAGVVLLVMVVYKYYLEVKKTVYFA